MSSACVEVWRGAVVESVHRVRVAVAGPGGELRAGWGDVESAVFGRSAIKPLQALPLVEAGGLERFGLTDRELALCCGSHGGEPRHVEAAASILAKIGADVSALACGPHAPMHAASAQALQRRGAEPGRLHNNCSGKHAGMLALARLEGWPLGGYERPEHPVQQRMLEVVSEWTGVAAEEVGVGTDGCGVVTFAVPLRALAVGYARLAAASRSGQRGTAQAAARVVEAMVRHPEMVAGKDRLCTALMRVSEGRIFAKVGAEGVYCAGVPGAELGVAVKVEDGAKRAAEPALLAALRAVGVLSPEQVADLARWAEPDVENTRAERVGRIRARLDMDGPDA